MQLGAHRVCEWSGAVQHGHGVWCLVNACNSLQQVQAQMGEGYTHVFTTGIVGDFTAARVLQEAVGATDPLLRWLATASAQLCWLPTSDVV